MFSGIQDDRLLKFKLIAGAETWTRTVCRSISTELIELSFIYKGKQLRHCVNNRHRRHVGGILVACAC